jgi:hypothetical protein
LGERNFAARDRHRRSRKPHVDRQRRHCQQEEGGGRELDSPVRQQGRAKRARGDPDREQQIDRDLDVDAAADTLLDDDRHER